MCSVLYFYGFNNANLYCWPTLAQQGTGIRRVTPSKWSLVLCPLTMTVMQLTQDHVLLVINLLYPRHPAHLFVHEWRDSITGKTFTPLCQWLTQFSLKLCTYKDDDEAELEKRGHKHKCPTPVSQSSVRLNLICAAHKRRPTKSLWRRLH